MTSTAVRVRWGVPRTLTSWERRELADMVPEGGWRPAPPTYGWHEEGPPEATEHRDALARRVADLNCSGVPARELAEAMGSTRRTVERLKAHARRPRAPRPGRPVYRSSGRRSEAAMPLAMQLVGTVHDHGPDAVAAVLDSITDTRAVLVVLAAMVDPTKSPSELLPKWAQ